MRPLVVANFERIEGTAFIVAILYGEDGQRIDGITLPCDSSTDALAIVRHLAKEYRISTVEMWTSDSGLYVQSLTMAGIYGVIKHPSDTEETRREIEQSAEILRELYEIKPLIPKPSPPKWRAYLISVVRRVLNKLEGDGKYEI